MQLFRVPIWVLRALQNHLRQVYHILRTSKGLYFEGFGWGAICGSFNPLAGSMRARCTHGAGHLP